MGLQKKETTAQEVRKWQDSYAGLMQAAFVGKQLRGIVHNLNGAIQAFSMQSELFALMFHQMDQLLNQIECGTVGGKEDATAKLKELLTKRASLAEQMAGKVELCQQIVQRTLLLQPTPEGTNLTAIPLADLVAEQTTFLSADSFFKHKVSKKMNIDGGLKVNSQDVNKIRLALQVVLENALDAVRGLENPTIEINAEQEKDHIRVEIQDNGTGVSEAVRGQLFNPFISDKDGHVGLGLYVAHRELGKVGGGVDFLSRRGGAVFALRLSANSAEEN